MTQPDPIVLDLDASGYVTSLGQASSANQEFGGSVRSTVVALSPLQQALNSVTPSRAALAGMAGFTAVAAKAESQLSTLKATSKTTGANFEVLTKNTRELSRQLPIGNSGARELVGTITKLGMATKGSEKTVIELSKTFTRLGGATGENPQGLAAGMIQLSRATGTGFNTKRIEGLADSLTTVSAKSGASATGILNFSKAIAPMAQASGIGTTKIMGISAAFTKMGEDGFGAANAFNKMLGDLNRSVREGSPEMNKYAQIVGKSAGEFERLFKADPTEAITQVTEAIGKAGNNGPRLLEGLGLEGVRTQRYLQQLSASGGLREAVTQSTGAYDTGSTATAAAEAFGGLSDSTTRLKTVLEQTAEALGTPFLGALTNVTDVLGAGVSGVRAVAETEPVQRGMQALSAALIPVLLAFKAIPSLITAMGLSQAATSGPIRGLLGGYAAAGGIGSRLAGRLGGDAYNRVVASGAQPGSDRMAPINQRMAGYGARAGGFLPGGGGTGPGFFRQLTGAGAMGAGMYLRTLSETARQARLPFDQRGVTAMRPLSVAADRFMAGRTDLMGQRDAGALSQQQYRAAIRDLSKETAGAARPIGILTRGVMELGKQTAMSSVAMGGRAAGGAMRAGGALVGAMGGVVGAGLTAAMVGGMAMSKDKANDRERADELKNATNFMDDYRVAMGKATEATSTFAGAMNEAAKANAKIPETIEAAMKVTAADVANAAAADPKSRLKDYRGGSGQASRRIALETAGSKPAPDEIQRIEQDLLMSGYDAATVEQILSGARLGGGGGNDSARNDVANRVKDLAKAPRDNGTGGWRKWLDVGGMVMPASTQASGGFQMETLSKGTEQGAAELTTGIRDRAGKRSETYSPEYARSEQLGEMDAAIAAAIESGNIDLQRRLTENFQTSLGVQKPVGISTKDIEAAGGFSAALANIDEAFRTGTYAPNQEAQSTGKAEARISEGWVARTLGKDSPFAQLFSATGKGRANSAVQGLIGVDGTPESPSAQLKAVQTSLSFFANAGTSMQDLSAKATEAANKLGSVDAATTQFLAALRQAAQQQVNAQAPFQSSGETMAQRAQMAMSDAALDPSTPENAAIQRQGVQTLIDLQDQLMQKANARFTQQRELQVQTGRMEVDFARNQAYSLQDYNRQRERQVEQYGVTVLRSEKQYLRQRGRSVEDFQRQVMISQRDFNKQMSRMAADGAKAMYDPYQRIQVQQVWDAGNMLGNLTEQNDALARQMGNLDTLRAQGGSSDLIKLLGLNDPKNAQQLASIVEDVSRDPAVIDALNTAAQQRMTLGGGLYGDRDNTQVQRAKEDFEQQLKDQSFLFEQMLQRGEADYDLTITQMAEDQARALRYAAEERTITINRAVTEYDTAVQRMHEDVKRNDTQIVTTLAQSTQMMNDIIGGQVVSFHDTTKDTLADTLKLLTDFQSNYSAVLKNTGVVVSIAVGNSNYADGNAASARGAENGARGGGGTGGPGFGGVISSGRISSEFGQRNGRLHAGIDVAAPVGTPIKAYRGGVVEVASYLNGYGNAIYINHGNGRSTRYGHLSGFKVRPGEEVDAGEVIGMSGNTGRSSGPHLHFETRVGGRPINPRAVPFALGGIATEPTYGLVAEAGSDEAIIPLNEQGIGVLADAMKRFISPEDSRAMAASNGTVYITYDNSRTTHDNRVIIEHVDLQAESPRELAAAAAAKARRDNLTAPPQRRST